MPRVLVVEDSPVMRGLIGSLVDELGEIDVVEVESERGGGAVGDGERIEIRGRRLGLRASAVLALLLLRDDLLELLVVVLGLGVVKGNNFLLIVVLLVL